MISTSISTPSVAYVDTETGGLDPRHRPWEIGIILTWGGDSLSPEHERRYLIHVADFDPSTADPKALDMNGFHHRHPQGAKADASLVATHMSNRAEDYYYLTEEHAAAVVADILDGCVIIACNAGFDVYGQLAPMLARHGHLPTWHYNPVDVTAYAAGVLGWPPSTQLSSRSVADALGVFRDMSTAHSAMADCEYARTLALAAQLHSCHRRVPVPASVCVCA